jgi:hypothetical protein
VNRHERRKQKATEKAANARPTFAIVMSGCPPESLSSKELASALAAVSQFSMTEEKIPGRARS